MVALGTAVLILFLNSGLAIAQCPMCGKAAEYAGATPGEANRTLAMAVVVLLVPTFAIMGGMAALLWKHRRVQGGMELDSRPDPPDSS